MVGQENPRGMDCSGRGQTSRPETELRFHSDWEHRAMMDRPEWDGRKETWKSHRREIEAWETAWAKASRTAQSLKPQQETAK